MPWDVDFDEDFADEFAALDLNVMAGQRNGEKG